MSQKGRKSRPEAARMLEFAMHGRRLAWAAAALLLLAVLAAGWMLLSPGWAVTAMRQASEDYLGRSFSANGGAHLDLSPLSIRIDGGMLPGADPGDSFITAKSITVPVSLGQLLARKPDLSALTLTDADIALVIDEEGRASWDLPDARMAAPLKITLEQSTIRYFDARNNQSLLLSNVDGLLESDAEGRLSFKGSTVVNFRVLRIDATLKSLARVNHDGSPFDVAVSTDIASASFSGMVATGNLLTLAGPVNLTSPDPAGALQWLGIAMPDNTKLPAPLTIDGALDSAGRAFAIHKAAAMIGALQASGEIAIDLRGDRPKLQGSLAVDSAWLDPLVPASGAEGGDWGRRVLPFKMLRGFDVELALAAGAVHYGPFTAGASKLQVLLKDGQLETTGALQLPGGGSVNVILDADASVLPPAGRLSLKAENVDAGPLISAVTGLSVFSGSGTLSADLAAQGQTQEEMVSTLKGVAAFSLGQGRITGTDLPGLASAVRERILDGWGAAPGATPYTAFTGAANVADGIATFRTLSVEMPQASFTASGTVDLLRRAADLKSTAASGETPLLPVPIIVKGKWDAPRIYPDVPQILENPEGGFARLKDPGAIAPPAGGN